MDRDTGRSKGFGFVEMGSEEEAQAAIAALNGKEIEGRTITVNEARPREVAAVAAAAVAAAVSVAVTAWWRGGGAAAAAVSAVAAAARRRY